MIAERESKEKLLSRLYIIAVMHFGAWLLFFAEEYFGIYQYKQFLTDVIRIL